jgi:hypothetical protein
MSNLIPTTPGIFGSQQGDNRRSGGALSRSNKREIEQIAARVELETAAEQARAFLVAHAMTNVATLVNQAEAIIKVSPATAQLLENLVAGYAISANTRISRM